MLATPDRTRGITRATTRLCLHLGWAPLPEVTLPNGRRADILALRPDTTFAIIEIKSCARDYLSDTKWPDYRAYCDTLLFAVDLDFPQTLLPDSTGLIIADTHDATLLRDGPTHPLHPTRRRSLLTHYATLAATRLACLQDPTGTAERHAALALE
jgi:hypothetical protein